ncbi:MAG: hypothetical protein JXJ04_08075 [Spirochaetales bacterium]|nr:hypothetical protein [Spirochaetales bacterium]
MEIFLPGDEQVQKMLKVLKDLEQYRENIVLVGGWLPYMYVTYVWNIKSDTFVIKTTDIDFAVSERYESASPLILDTLKKSKDYITEPVYSDEDSPFDICVLYGKENTSRMRIDFLSHEFCNPAEFQKKLLGVGVNIIPLETVEFMLKKTSSLEITIPADDKDIRCTILKPSGYLFIKGLSFATRSTDEDHYKYIKDMWSMYFVLDTVPLPEKKQLFQELLQYKEEEKEYYDFFLDNISTYFTGENPKGVTDLTSLLKTAYPESVIRKRIQKKFAELVELLEGR